MGSPQLIDRYMYGNNHPIYRELMTESPNREKKMICLLEDQIKWNQRVGVGIIAGNAIGTKIVSNEIKSMNESLSGDIRNLESNLSGTITSSMNDLSDSLNNNFNGLSNGLYEVGDNIVDAIFSIGDQIGMELIEIKWQMMQQSNTLDEVLEVLHNNRSNEARQFFDQGVRHYLIGEYSEAEERFKKALDNDSTDYQSLFNMGFIEIHKNNSDLAFKYFNKALKLPKNLDKSLQEKTLIAIARLYYTQSDYKSAFIKMKEAVQINRSEENLYKMAIYAGLSGDDIQLFSSMDELIDANPTYFVKFTTEKELTKHHSEITKRLAKRVDTITYNIQKALQEYYNIYCIATKYADKIDLKLTDVLSLIDSYIRKIKLENLKYKDLVNFHRLLSRFIECEKGFESCNLNFELYAELKNNNEEKITEIDTVNQQLALSIDEKELIKDGIIEKRKSLDKFIDLLKINEDSVPFFFTILLTILLIGVCSYYLGIDYTDFKNHWIFDSITITLISIPCWFGARICIGVLIIVFGLLTILIDPILSIMSRNINNNLYNIKSDIEQMNEKLNQGVTEITRLEIEVLDKLNQLTVVTNELLCRINNILASSMLSKAVFELVDFPKKLEEYDDNAEVKELDPLFEKAKQLVIENQMASVSMLQRALSIGYARSGKIIDQLERNRVIGPHLGSKPREVLINSIAYSQGDS